MPTHDDATVAAVFRAALSLGIATPADLVPWADGQVMARERPAEWVLDLSIGAAASADQVRADLRDLAWPVDGTTVFRLLVGLTEVVGPLTWEGVSALSTWMLQAAKMHASQDTTYEIDVIDDGIYLCDEGVMGNRSDLTADVLAFRHRDADPAARAWLPGVRVRFGDDRRCDQRESPI